MKAVILAGGLGTRISEETHLKPKPLIEIGGMPLLWHIMKIYSSHNVNDFVICCGYKGYLIKEYFANYFLHMSDVTIDIKQNKMEVHNRFAEPWKVTLVDTGLETMTGGRLKRIKNYLDDETFCFTYGDGLSDIDITKMTAYHKNNQFEQARALYTSLLKKDPGNKEALNNFLVLIAKEAPKDALIELEKMERLNSDFSPIAAQIAMIHLKLGNLDEAARYLRRSILLSPTNISYQYNLAIIYDRLGKKEQAVQLYHQVIDAVRGGAIIPGSSIDKLMERMNYLEGQIGSGNSK